MPLSQCWHLYPALCTVQLRLMQKTLSHSSFENRKCHKYWSLFLECLELSDWAKALSCYLSQSFCAVQRGLDCTLSTHSPLRSHVFCWFWCKWSSQNLVPTIITCWTNRVEFVTGPFVCTEVDDKVHGLWLLLVAASNLSKLKDLWFSFRVIQNFSVSPYLFVFYHCAFYLCLH